MKKIALLFACCSLLSGCTNEAKGVLKNGETLYIYVDAVQAGAYSVLKGHQTYVAYEIRNTKAEVIHTDYYTQNTLTDYYYGNNISYSIKAQ